MGFSNRSYLLQIIPGSLLLASIFLVVTDASSIFDAFRSMTPVMLLPFLFIAFIIGAMLDLVADCLETKLYKCSWIKQPSRYLLYRGEVFGIKLPHNETIKMRLSKIVSEHSDCPRETVEYFSEVFENSTWHYGHEINRREPCCRRMVCNRKNRSEKNVKANHLFQAARSLAFRENNKSQIDKMEAFFSLYIFSRNTCLCLLIISIFTYFPCLAEKVILSGDNVIFIFRLSLFVSTVLFGLAYYRYKVYYSRSVLESLYGIGKPVGCSRLQK